MFITEIEIAPSTEALRTSKGQLMLTTSDIRKATSKFKGPKFWGSQGIRKVRKACCCSIGHAAWAKMINPETRKNDGTSITLK